MADAFSRRPDFEERHLNTCQARIELSTLAALRVDHVQNTLDSDIKESYMQGKNCCLLIDHFGRQNVTLSSHLKTKLNRFSYNDGLL